MALGLSHNQTTHATLEVEGRQVPLVVQVNRRARRLIVRVRHLTGEVIVVAPNRKSVREALAFAESHKAWIAAQLRAVPQPVPFEPGACIPVGGHWHQVEHCPQARAGVFVDADLLEGHKLCVSGAVEHLPRRVEDYLKRRARQFLSERTALHCAQLGVRVPRISLRDPKTRWGSCSTASGISYSWRLIMAPEFVADYVAAHEAAHLVHMNHSAKFWRLVSTLTPQVKAATDWLSAEGRTLHRYGVAEVA